MTKVYATHKALGDRSTNPAIQPTLEELEKMGDPLHYKPLNLGDHIAERLVGFLRPLTHLMFKDKYNHHALVLETVAALPGMIGGAFRHMRSLRTMRRDFAWIHNLWEEAENERMHLLIWMQVTQPTRLERAMVLVAQLGYGFLYTVMYMFTPRIAHRFVGYLEEEAVAAYTHYLKCIDSGALPNGPAPTIAKKYYELDDNATIRDVVLHVRGDECMHRTMNHKLAELAGAGLYDSPPHYPPDFSEQELQAVSEPEKKKKDSPPLPENK